MEIEGKVENLELLKKAKDLFFNCKLKECIAYIESIDSNLSLELHQTLQMYRGLSFFESQQISEAFHCFESIIDEVNQQKGIKVDEIDVVLRAQYQLEVLYYCPQMAEEFNSKLLVVTEEYQRQNENSEGYEKGVFLFGMGTYHFIENSREGMKEIIFTYLEEAYSVCKKYEQEISIMIGWAYFYCGKVDKSCKWFERLYKQNPFYPSAANNYAICLQQKKEDPEFVEKLYLEEEKLRGYNQVILHNISLYYSQQDNEAKEKEYMEKLFALTPKTQFIYSKYGKYLLTQNRIQEGVSLMKKAIEVDPKDLASYEQMIEYEMDHDLSQAILYCEKCIELYPNDGYSRFRLAQVYYQFNNLEEAEIHLKDSLRLKNNSIIKHYSEYLIGDIWDQQGEEEDKIMKQYFKSCNYDTDDSYLIPQIISRINSIIMRGAITWSETIENINNQQQLVVQKFKQFSNSPETTFLLRGLYLYRLDSLRNNLSILAYQKFVQQELTYKSQTQFWDLFLL